MKHLINTSWLFLLSLTAFVIMNNIVAQEPDGAATAIRSKISVYFSPPDEYKGNFGNYRSPLKFYNGTEVKTANDWQKRRKEILDQWNKMMGAWPPLLKDQKLEILETSRRENFTQHRVRFNWTPAEKTEGYLLVPDGPGKKPAVITVYYEPETAIGLKEPLRDFAYQLTKRGFVTLSIGTTD